MEDKKFTYEDILDLMKYIYKSSEIQSSHVEVVNSWLKTKENEKIN